jgi:ribosomal protein S3
LYNELKVKGLKLKLKGKIGVAGNARTRTLLYKIGKTGQSRIQNKVSYSLTYVYTFTGMIGLQL